MLHIAIQNQTTGTSSRTVWRDARRGDASQDKSTNANAQLCIIGFSVCIPKIAVGGQGGGGDTDSTSSLDPTWFEESHMIGPCEELKQPLLCGTTAASCADQIMCKGSGKMSRMRCKVRGRSRREG